MPSKKPTKQARKRKQAPKPVKGDKVITLKDRGYIITDCYVHEKPAETVEPDFLPNGERPEKIHGMAQIDWQTVLYQFRLTREKLTPKTPKAIHYYGIAILALQLWQVLK